MTREELMERSGATLEFGDGWLEIFENTLDRLDALNIEYNMFYAKENSGLLSVYIGPKDKANTWHDAGVWSDVNSIIDEVWQASGSICEECGEPGEKRGASLIKTLCPKHRQKWNDEHRDIIEADKRRAAEYRAKLEAAGVIQSYREYEYREKPIPYVTMSDIMAHHSANDAEEFRRWMSGKTGILVSSNEGEDQYGYYAWDYEKWLLGKKNG